MSKNKSQQKWDIDLEFGEKGEDFVREILQGNGKIEVKTERDNGSPKQWKTTGNIAIERTYRGKPSGLSVTEAKTWIHLLTCKGKFEGGFIISVDDLKKRINELYKKKEVRVVMGGDDNASELFLVPIDKIFN